MPASGPKPTALMKMMAMMTGLKARQKVTMKRAGQVTQAGMRLRAPRMAMGRESSTPKKVASTAICRLSTRPVSSCGQSLKFGGNIRARKRAPLSMPLRKRSAEKSSWPRA